MSKQINMAITLSEFQAIQEIAQHLYDFLPGSPHPYANKDISFPGVAHKLGLSNYWTGGSKLPATKVLLEKTLEHRRERFWDLILEIVRQGITYKGNKGNSVTREEIQKLNELIVRVGFKIPDLWSQIFLDSLPSSKPQSTPAEVNLSQKSVDKLKAELLGLEKMDPRARGVPFEKFLKNLFEAFGLTPHSAFNLVGEQIDGSLQ